MTPFVSKQKGAQVRLALSTSPKTIIKTSTLFSLFLSYTAVKSVSIAVMVMLLWGMMIKYKGWWQPKHRSRGFANDPTTTTNHCTACMPILLQIGKFQCLWAQLALDYFSQGGWANERKNEWKRRKNASRVTSKWWICVEISHPKRLRNNAHLIIKWLKYCSLLFI